MKMLVIPLLRLPLLLLVTSPVSSDVTGVGSFSGAALQNLLCCDSWPSLNYVKKITCTCPDIDMITIRQGDIPKTVQAVTILDTNHVIIGKNSINGLQHLTNFTISGISMLQIKKDGMASQEESRLNSVTFYRIGTLQIESKAFSGVWQPRTSIQMHHIGVLNVEPYALDYQVAMQGIIVSLLHVKKLSLNANGFSSMIYKLKMINVSIDECYNGSFGGHTTYTEMKNVNISKANIRCIHATNSFATVIFESLTIDQAYPKAITGEMDKFIIHNIHINTIHQTAFDVCVNTIQIINSSINVLQRNGISIVARKEIRLNHIHIGDLQTNALSGLRMNNTLGGVRENQIISQFTIDQSHQGSLTLSEKSNFQNLKMNCMQVASCPTCPEVYSEKCVRMLIAANQTGPLSVVQNAVFRSLIGNKSCDEKNSPLNQSFHLNPASPDFKERSYTNNVAGDDTDDINNFEIGNEDIHRTLVLTLGVTLSLGTIVVLGLVMIMWLLRHRNNSKSGLVDSQLADGLLKIIGKESAIVPESIVVSNEESSFSGDQFSFSSETHRNDESFSSQNGLSVHDYEEIRDYIT